MVTIGPPKMAKVSVALANDAISCVRAMKIAPATMPAIKSHDSRYTMSIVHTLSVEGGTYAPGSGATKAPKVDAICCSEIDETTNCPMTKILFGSIVSVTRCRTVHEAAIARVVVKTMPAALVYAFRRSEE